MRTGMLLAAALLATTASAGDAATYVQYQINTSAVGAFFDYPVSYTRSSVFGTFWIVRQVGDPLSLFPYYTISSDSIVDNNQMPVGAQRASFSVSFATGKFTPDVAGYYGSESFISSSFATGNVYGKGGYYTDQFGRGQVDSVIIMTSDTPFAHPIGLTFDITGAAVPEAATWAMMLSGFGLIGTALRRRRTRVAFG